MNPLNKLQVFKTKIQRYRAKHVKIKDFTFMEWVHNAIQVVAAGMGSYICAGRVVMMEEKTLLWMPNPINNPWYWYWNFGFVASGLISAFGLWDIYNWGTNQVKILHAPMECDGISI